MWTSTLILKESNTAGLCVLDYQKKEPEKSQRLQFELTYNCLKQTKLANPHIRKDGNSIFSLQITLEDQLMINMDWIDVCVML